MMYTDASSRSAGRSGAIDEPGQRCLPEAASIKDEEILIGQGVDKPDAPLPNIVSISPAFKDNCPLWTYILAEAMNHRVKVKTPTTKGVEVMTPRLGPVGGRIVAEVFLGLMFGDNNSLLSLDPNWHPAAGSNYALKDLVNYALGK